MTIPLEVLKAADEAGRGHVVDVFAAEVIAVWARKEALREAADEVSTIRDRYLPGYQSRRPLGDAIKAIRALAEGVSDGQQ